jgi:hypothetical protein
MVSEKKGRDEPIEQMADESAHQLVLLQTDLVFCCAFTDIAKKEIEHGEREFALRVLARAEEVHAAIARYIAGIDQGEQRRWIEQKLRDVRERLDHLKSEVEALITQDMAERR